MTGSSVQSASPGRRRGVWVVATIVSLALLASGLMAVAVTRPDKSTGIALPELAAEPFAVTLSAALGGSTAAVGSTVTLGSQAIGRGRQVAALELWDGARLVERRAVSARKPAASFGYQALTTGPHLLHARGIAVDGLTARSAPVAIDVAMPKLPPPPVAVTPLPGESASALATRLGVAPSRIGVQTSPARGRGAYPTLAKVPAGPLPVGAAIAVAVGPAVQPPSPLEQAALVVPDAPQSGSGTPEGAPDSQPLLPPQSGSSTLAVGARLTIPELRGPTLALQVDGCKATLRVSGTGGKKSTIERASAGQPGFLVDKDRQGDGTLQLGDLLPGTHLWEARTSEGVSSPVSATVPDTCAKTGWSGDASLVQGILTIPSPSSQVYLYLGVDDAPFVRVPKSDGQFVSAPTRRVDVSSLLPAVDGSRLRLEVWQQVDGFPVKMATGNLVLPEGSTLSEVIGEPSAIELKAAVDGKLFPSAAPKKDGPVYFVWNASSPRVTGVLWQVLGVPLTTANTDVSPFGTLATGFSMSSSGNGAFSIDTTKLARLGPPTPAAAGAPATNVITALKPPDLKGRTTSFPSKVASLDPTKPASTAEVVSALDELAPLASGRVWVRVLPLVHTKGAFFDGPMGIASSTVPVDLPVVREPLKAPDLTVKSLQLEVGSVGNPALRGCVRVLKTPWKPTSPLAGSPEEAEELRPYATAVDPVTKTPIAYDRLAYTAANSGRAFFPYPGTWCTSDYKAEPCDDAFCGFVEFLDDVVNVVAKAWDYVAAAYNGIIKLAVDVLANFNPVCLAAKAANSALAQDCVAIAGVVAQSVITAVLAAYGLPPSLPTSDDVIAIAEGDLEVLAVTALKGLGVPCDSLKLDEAQSAAVVKGAGKAGVAVPNAGGQVDGCRIAARLLINEVKKQVSKEANSKASAATGWSPFTAPGLVYVIEPLAYVQPTQVVVTATSSQPLAEGLAAIFTPACNVFVDLTISNDMPGPFKGASGRMHLVPKDKPDGVLEAVSGDFQSQVDAIAAATGGPTSGRLWQESLIMSTPSSPNILIESVFETMKINAKLSGDPCLKGALTVSDRYDGPRPRPH